MKKCTKCNVIQELTSFSFKNKSLGKLQTQCKSCVAERDKKSYSTESRKTSIRKAAKVYQQKCRDFVNNYKKEKGCSRCEEDRFYVLEFHHQGDKESNVADLVSDGVSIKKLLLEIEKCIVVCANCHKEIHYLERIGQVS